MKRILLAFTFLVSLSPIIPAQQMNSAKLDSLLTVLEQNDKFMGSIAVSHDGTLIYTKAVGFADLTDSIAATPETEYRIGSISKMFTAALTFKAAEKGILDLDQTIKGYFPKLDNADKIKIRYLLNHRSGIHNFTGEADYKEWETEPRTEQQLIDLISGFKSDFEPDSKAEYSNSNYVLLSFILEKAYKKPYKELVETYIIKPLGLKHTAYGGPADPKKGDSYSYHYDQGWVKAPETDMSIPVGAGALVSTPSDLCRFITGLFDGKIISMESLDQMKTMKENYGMGMFEYGFGDKKGYGHNGGIDGFRSNLGYIPEDKVSIAMTSNGMNYNMNSIMIDVLNSYYNIPFRIPEFNTIESSEADLQKYTGEYSSTQIALKIKVFTEGNKLKAQATGQSSFPLEQTAPNVFHFDQAGIVMEFDPENKSMVLKQGGGEFRYTKD
ncbi:serine hydrolase domain-containing protein [Saccharicrinis sp. FJH54]|uniref:serine hydrolase domain-containing protein n=1 Tax=Saccharicrinis sp. FJH54 TaxID=3344665 RepID=UPI0035D4389A